nr:MAG TPA: hypothetical protein [Caudoviricetes sp.]
MKTLNRYGIFILGLVNWIGGNIIPLCTTIRT